MTKPEIVPLTRELYRQVEGDDPPFTIKGLAVVLDGKAIGVAAMTCGPGDVFVIATVSDALKNHKRAVLKAWDQLKDMFIPGQDYYTVRDTEISTSHGFLTHLGFEPLEDDIYVYRGH